MHTFPADISSIRAVVFDWAGTVLDHGSQAPMAAFVEAFERFGIDLTIGEARLPMGLPKRKHIEAILNIPRIADVWIKTHGSVAGETDVDAIYAAFIPLNQMAAADHCRMVPGVLDVVHELRKRGLRIGSTTGYTRSIMELILAAAAEQGYVPDNLVCADDLPHGRPTPMGMYKCFLDLSVWPARAVVKVDDTAPGIAEGVAAGCWTVGVTLSGNSAGLSETQVSAMTENERQELHQAIGVQLLEAGAHFVIPTAAELLPVLEQIELALAQGIYPPFVSKGTNRL